MKVKRFTKFKQIFLVLLASILMFAANLGIFGIFHPAREVFAATSISNGEFNTSSSSNPATPSSSEYVTTSSSSNVRVTSGIVNLNSADYNKYPKRNNGETNQYVLSISSTTKRTLKDENGDPIDVEESHPASFGYKTAYTINLDNNKYYKFSIAAHTSNRNGIGKIALLDADDGDRVLLEKSAIVTPNNMWQDFYLLVSTTDKVKYNVKVAMYLDGEGTVLYDNLRFEEVDKTAFETAKQYTSLSATLTNDYTFDKHIESTDLSFVGGSHKDSALCVELNNTTTSGEIAGSELDIDRNILYKISVYVKATDLKGSATLKFAPSKKPDNQDEPNDNQIASLTLSNSTDYVPIDFYVRGYPLDATKYIFKLQTENASGKIYISKIIINYCNDSQFSAASAGNSVAKLDLTSIYLSENTVSSDYVSNGTFNNGKLNDEKSPYPLTPENWTVDANPTINNSKAQFYGIVNLADKQKMQENGQIFANQLPDTDPYGNQGNVLMLYPADGSLSYKSASNSISSGYFKYQLNITTINEAKVELVANNSDGEIVLLSKIVKSSDNWLESNCLTLYGKAGYSTTNVCLKITAANNNTTFVDEVKFYSNVTEEEFNSAQSKVDLTVLTNKNFYTATDVNFEIVDASIYDFQNTELKSKINEQTSSWNNKKVLQLRQSNAGAGKVSSTLGYSLASGKFYKLSFSVYTEISEERQGEYEGDYGLNISLSGFTDNTFENIVSKNGFTNYTFYIKATNTSSSTSYLTIEMGNSDVYLSGEAYVGNFEFRDDLTEQEFNKHSANSTTKILTTPVEENNNDTNTDSDNNKDSGKQGFNWDVLPSLLSAILTAVAIIVAVVGVILRKVKFKKPAKKTKNEYDRNKTVSKQYYARKAIELQQAKLAELNAELKSLTDERAKYEESYKADLSKLREMKIRRADKAEIGKLEKELKQNQKASASIGVAIARVESDIDYVNSASFMTAMTKRLENEMQEEIVDETELEKDAEPKQTENNEDTKKSTARTKSKEKAQDKKSAEKSTTKSEENEKSASKKTKTGKQKADKKSSTDKPATDK